MALFTLGRLAKTQRLLQDWCQLEVDRETCDSFRIRNDIQRRHPNFRWDRSFVLVDEAIRMDIDDYQFG